MAAKKVIVERTLDGKIVKYEYLVDGKPVPEGHKYCPSCSSIKLISDFTPKGTACKPCASERSKQHYLKVKLDPQLQQEKRNKINEQNKQKKLKAIEHLGGKCQDCGGVFHHSVYDFHHTDMNTKEGNPSSFLAGSWEKAKEELSKCVLLCSNCHRFRHFGGG